MCNTVSFNDSPFELFRKINKMICGWYSWLNINWDFENHISASHHILMIFFSFFVLIKTGIFQTPYSCMLMCPWVYILFTSLTSWVFGPRVWPRLRPPAGRRVRAAGRGRLRPSWGPRRTPRRYTGLCHSTRWCSWSRGLWCTSARSRRTVRRWHSSSRTWSLVVSL